ncbi:MAG: site-specific integrase [Thermodesulfobacteriota bacterium]|nr:site-specific integrase [Thermodesulfobacteriota bacterium]
MLESAFKYFWVIELSLRKFNQEFGDILISKIKSIDLENYQTKRKAEGLEDSTIDAEIGSAKTMVFKVFHNDMISGDTLKVFQRVKKLLKNNANARDRVLSIEEFNNLMDKAPSHIKPIIATGYYTGMRKEEILILTWEKVDLKNQVISLDEEDTKDNEAGTIPICDEFYKILENLPRAIHDHHLFLYGGGPITDFRTALKNTCLKANIVYGRFKKNGLYFTF